MLGANYSGKYKQHTPYFITVTGILEIVLCFKCISLLMIRFIIISLPFSRTPRVEVWILQGVMQSYL